MSDPGENSKPESNTTEEVFEVTDEHLQNLTKYICNLSSAVIDAEPEKITSLLSLEPKKNLLKLFISEESSKIISITKNEEDSSNEYLFETEPSYKPYQNSTIIFIKRVPKLDCLKQKLIKRDIQMLNFTGGNDLAMFSYMQNCIQSAFSPLFTSYEKTLRPDAKNVTTKIESCKDVNLKMNELAILLDKAQTNTDIFDVKLEIHPLIKEKVDEYYEKNNKYPTAEEIKPYIDDKTMNKIYEMINKWKTDIMSFTKAENDMDKGDSFDEINFWKKADVTQASIKKQIESPENKIMYELARISKKVFAINSLEEEVHLKEYISKVSFYNMNLKDINIIGLLKTNSLNEIGPILASILSAIKNNLRTMYPIQRKLKLLEKIKQDLNKHIIKLLGNKLMTMDYEDFYEICKELDHIFKDVWKAEIENIRKETQATANLENIKINIDSSLLSNPFQIRIDELKKIREEHRNFIELSQNLIFSNENEEDNSEQNSKNNLEMKNEIEEAYHEFSKVDILDLSGNGEKNWIDAKENYRKKMEEIENKISNYLKQQLAKAQNSSEQYKIFKRFQQLSQKQRIHLGLQEYQNAFVEEIKNQLTELLNTLLAGYENNTASQMSKIKRIPEISGNYIWLSQFERKAKVLKNKIEIILGENWENLNDGKKIKQLIESIKKNSDKSRLIERFSKETGNTPSDIGNEKLMDIVKKRNGYEIKINFEDKLIDKFKEFRMLSGKTESKITPYIKTRLVGYKSNYINAIALQESFKAFHNSCNKIENDPVIDKLVAKQKRDILSLVKEKHNITWSNVTTLPKLISDISEKISIFEETVNDLLVRVEKINSLLAQIQNSEINDNKTEIKEKIKNIQNLLDEIKGCSNMSSWISSIDNSLSKILIKIRKMHRNMAQ